MKLNNLKKKMWFCLIVALFLFQYSFANTYYVSTTGNDTSGDGSASNPWKTLMYAVTKVAANQGHTIQVGAGTFIESGLVEVPLGVNITGAGIDMTIFKAASSFYYHPADPGYGTATKALAILQLTEIRNNYTEGFMFATGITW